MLPEESRTAEKMLATLKGLHERLEPDETPLFNIPAIWDSGQGQRSMPCDAVLTNQRLMGYVYVTFPRERLFLEAFPLKDITNVSVRQKSFEPLFRELMISDGTRKVYIRAPRQKIETLYEALRAAIAAYAPRAQTTFEAGSSSTPPETQARPAPVYGRQEIRAPFERSSLALTLLFIGGIVLEIFGVIIWTSTQSTSTGLPLCIAGFAAVLTAILTRRRR